MRRNLPPKELFLGKTIPQFPKHKILEYIDSGANGHLFRAFDESTNSNLAFKIIPAGNLKSNYLEEASKANSLQHSSVVSCHGVIEYSTPEIPCVIFIYDYVKGKNLRDYIRQERANVNVPFIEGFLRSMFELLYELKQRKLFHGDLHAGNILISKSEYDIYGRITFRVTDFRVGELTGHPSHPNDYLYIAETLRQLLECVEYPNCESRDRYAYEVLRHDFLERHLTETNPLADTLATNPQKMLEKLDSIDEEFLEKAKGEIVPKLVTPFDYPNCEQIGNSHLLLKNLYSDRLLGLSDIQERSNLVLTGPRGCGKTTVFRALSLDYLMSTGNDQPSEIDYIGIYYRCDDLYFSFPRYTTPERLEALDVPMHYLIVTLLATALEQINTWAKKHFLEDFKKKEEALVVSLWELFEWPQLNNPNARQLATLVDKLKGKERKRAAKKQRFVHVQAEPIEGYVGPGVLFDACRLIRNKFSFLRDRPFYFFIDDYSRPKITKELQANLNRLLMHRSPDAFFKLSTESPVSFVREDVDGKQFVESRELGLVNLGLRYINDDRNQTLEFLEDLFSRRFQRVEGYPVQTLEQLLGSIPRNENATARAFREKQGRQNYAGRETIAAMCSGDIHYIIRLVARMVDDYGGPDVLATSQTPCIPPQQQHDSIRAAAGSFMESVRTLPRWGKQLADVTATFGNVARSYLLYETSTNEANEPPHQASRIEPYEALNLSGQAQEILDELLRYSILIEDPRGKSRRGKVVPRFLLRRYLIPHFHLTFSKRDSLQLENHQVETLLCEPNKFEGEMRLKSKKDAERRRLRQRRGGRTLDQVDFLKDG